MKGTLPQAEIVAMPVPLDREVDALALLATLLQARSQFTCAPTSEGWMISAVRTYTLEDQPKVSA